MIAVEGLQHELEPAGLDIVHPFTVDEALDDLFVFPRFDQATRLGVIIGNSRALWTPFLEWLKRAARVPSDPLNHYVEEVLARALEALAVPHRLYLANRLDYDAGAGRQSAVPVGRLGSRVGLAALGPAHLSVHPEYGPWFAYRAVAVFDLPPPASANTARTEPCASCSAPCQAALERALGSQHSLEVERNWHSWVAVRDACPERPAARYPAQQIGYHYSKDPRFLGRNA